MGEDFRRARHAGGGRRACSELLEPTSCSAGALGLSTGLEYDPGIYSRAAPKSWSSRGRPRAAGGRYISHVRSEDRYFWEAIDEIIAIGREAKHPGAGLAPEARHAEPVGPGRQADRACSTRRAPRVSTSPPTSTPTCTGSPRSPSLFPERDFENRADGGVRAARDRRRRRACCSAPSRPEPSVRRARPWPRSRKLRGTDRPDHAHGADPRGARLREADGQRRGERDRHQHERGGRREADAPGRTRTSAPTASWPAAIRAGSAPIRACWAATCASAKRPVARRGGAEDDQPGRRPRGAAASAARSGAGALRRPRALRPRDRRSTAPPPRTRRPCPPASTAVWVERRARVRAWRRHRATATGRGRSRRERLRASRPSDGPEIHIPRYAPRAARVPCFRGGGRTCTS